VTARTGLSHSRRRTVSGAIVGPLLAAALVASIGVRHTLYLSAVPGLFAAIAITVAAREAKLGDAGRRRARLELNRLRQVGILPALIPVLAFELGNIATTLLILRATDLLHHGGRSIADATAVAILVYVGHNVAATIFAVVGGRWIDRTNPRRAFTAGAGIYIASYALFALTLRSWGMLLVAFVLAGAAIGFAETAESTLVAQLLPDELRGSGFGLLGALQAAGDLGSSAVAGLIWTLTSPSWAFAYAAAWMVVSVAAAGLVRAWSKPDSG